MSPPLVPDPPPGVWNGGERPEVLLSHSKNLSSPIVAKPNQTQNVTTLSGGSLGSCVDEERS